MPATYSTTGKLPHLQALTRASRLKGEGFRIALDLILRLDEAKFRRVNQHNIAEAIQTSQSNVSRSIGRVQAQGLILAKQSGTDGRRIVYKLPNRSGRKRVGATKPDDDEWD